MERLFRFAESEGVPREQMEQVVDARAIALWVRAMKYTDLQRRAKGLQRKRQAGKGAPVAVPGQGNRNRRRETDAEKQAREERDTLRSTGRPDAASGVIAKILQEQNLV
jgi:hypothetical protein